MRDKIYERSSCKAGPICEWCGRLLYKERYEISFYLNGKVITVCKNCYELLRSIISVKIQGREEDEREDL